MSPILLLTGLLALAYFGTMLVGGRRLRGFGLPSGTEFLLLGVLFGPKFMGVFTRQGLASFEELTIVALAWLSFVIGSHYGYAGGRRVSRRRVFGGIGLAAITLVLTGIPAAAIAFAVTDLTPRDLLVFGVAVGAVSAETTRHAVRWVVERYDAQGPLTTLVGDVYESDDAVPLLSLAVLTALGPTNAAAAIPYMPWSGLAATLAIGGAVGATCAALFDIEPRSSQRWGILLGTGLLTVGVSSKLGLSPVASMFVMGVSATRLSRDRAALQEMVGLTERAVMLPTLMLAGAYVSFPPAMPFLPIALVVIAGRAGAKLLSARMLWRAIDPHGRNPVLGLGLLPAGALSVSVGLAFELRAPGRLGEWVLALAVLHVVLGEIIGPIFLRRALRDADEITEVSAGLVAPPMPVPAARARAGARAIRSTTGRARSPSSPGGEERRHRSVPPGRSA